MSICEYGNGRHQWHGMHCLNCGAHRDAARDPVNWQQPLEPGPVKIDAPGDERKLCEQDAQQLGVGYMVDGKRVHPSRVTVFVLKPGGDND